MRPHNPRMNDALSQGRGFFPSQNQSIMRTILVCDVVESMVWMQDNEVIAISQWQAFVREVKHTVLPRYGARLVKSMGDGLLLEFDSSVHAHATPRAAIQAAHSLHGLSQSQLPFIASSQDAADQHRFQLRIAVHYTAVTVGEDDIYGHGVNLCARIAGLAGAGETLISCELRDQLIDPLDAQLQDMGECYLKHVDAPVQVYRAGSASQVPILMPMREYSTPLQAVVAVIPFAARSLAADAQLAIGEIIADGVIGQLSRTRDLKVISRLSTSAFRDAILSGSANKVTQIESHLGANYVLSGSYIALEKKLIVTAELAKSKTNEVVWMDRLEGDVEDILQRQSEICHGIANAAHGAIFNIEVQAAVAQPLPTLESYTLLLAGIHCLHRVGPADFLRSRDVLEALIKRHPQIAISRIWLALWHVMCNTRGMALAAPHGVNEAVRHTQHALQIDPSSSLALAMQGFVTLHLAKDVSGALDILDTATACNGSDALAWLFKSVALSFLGDGAKAVAASARALELSPIDPMRYYYESLAASSALAAEDYARAITLCQASLKRNAIHAHSYRALITAYWFAGQPHLAEQTAVQMLRHLPQTRIDNFLKHSASHSFAFGQKMAHAMLGAGIPR